MSKTTRSMILTGMLALVALASSACVTERAVTHIYWETPAQAYVAYAEASALETSAKVKKCDIAQDNKVICVEQENLNTVLNADD